MDWQSLASNLIIPGVLSLLSILAARYLVPYLKKLEKQADTGLKKELASLAVSFVEQKNETLKKLGTGADSGGRKKEEALDKFSSLLSKNKISMSRHEMGDMIEAVLGEVKLKK